MCIIAYKPKGKPLFTSATIREMFSRNPDGAGLMFCEDGQVVIKKGFMKCEDLMSYLDTTDWTDKNLVLHFRIGTSGLKDGMNCHPYPIHEANAVDMKTDLGMVHNGVLGQYNPPFNSTINDTQNFINKVLSKLTPDFIYSEDLMFMIHELIGTNKLLFLNDNDDVRMVGNFIEDDGYYFSNTSYKPYIIPKVMTDVYPFNSHYRTQRFDFDIEEEDDDDEGWIDGLTSSYLPFDDEMELCHYLMDYTCVSEEYCDNTDSLCYDYYEDDDGNVIKVDWDDLTIIKKRDLK